MLLILHVNIAVVKGGSTMHCKGEIILVYSSLLDIKTKLKCGSTQLGRSLSDQSSLT